MKAKPSAPIPLKTTLSLVSRLSTSQRHAKSSYGWIRLLVTSSSKPGSPPPDDPEKSLSATTEHGIDAPKRSEMTKEDLAKLEKMMKEFEKYASSTAKDSGPNDIFRPKSQYTSARERESSERSRIDTDTDTGETPQQASKSSGAGSSSTSSGPSKQQSTQRSSSQASQSPPKSSLTKPEEVTQPHDFASPSASETPHSESQSGDTSAKEGTSFEEAKSGSTLGRIQPKKITLEEAKVLGIDVNEATSAQNQSSRSSVWKPPRTEERRKHEERMKHAAARDGRPDLSPFFDSIHNFVTNRWRWILFGALFCAPTLLTWWNSDESLLAFSERDGFKPQWKRYDYIYLGNAQTESAIFEMCGLAALNALPPHNPISSPISAIQGHISPVFPKDRQGVTAPTFWKLRIDFPAPKETVWEKNDDTLVSAQPASPTYKGSQFMWILSRTWEKGEPVIRILTGRQVGGTIKANPKRNLVPWREPAFRPKRLGNSLLRPMEFDAMFKQLSPEHTMWFEALKRFGGVRSASDVLPDYDLSDYEYDMLEAKGYGDYIYNPDSVEWPANNRIIVDPLGALEEDEGELEQSIEFGEYGSLETIGHQYPGANSEYDATSHEEGNPS